MCGTFSAWSHGPVKGLLLTLALVTGMWLIAHNCESSWSLVQLLVDLTYSGKNMPILSTYRLCIPHLTHCGSYLPSMVI
jgi:hypothetical protein